MFSITINKIIGLNNSCKKILFDHLPKCGGSSINKFLEKNYPRRKTFSLNPNSLKEDIKKFKSFSEKKRYGFDLVKGHLAHSLINYVNPEMLKITILRDPVDRIISHYYYAKGNKNHYLHSKITNDLLSLGDYVTSGISNELRNWYVTHFTGLTMEEAEKNPETSINKAVEIVINNYDIIGLLDQMQQFTEDVFIKANLHYPFKGEKINASKRPDRKDVSEKEKDLIKEINFLDVLFYEKIKKVIGVK